MREIKFRIWDKIQKEMTHFYLFERPTASYGREHVISQFTGLHDKNGKEIYEGDIMTFTEVDEDSCVGATEQFIGTVQFITESGGYRFVEKSGRRRELYLVIGFPPVYDVKIIGNIHENPELLREVTSATQRP